MNTVNKGSAGENKVAAYLESGGWVVGHRRHRLGGGDLLAVHPDNHEVRLIECKANKGSQWGHFRPEEREALAKQARYLRCEALLAHIQGAKITFYSESQWP